VWRPLTAEAGPVLAPFPFGIVYPFSAVYTPQQGRDIECNEDRSNDEKRYHHTFALCPFISLSRILHAPGWPPSGR
jgi:hypothetical protein